MRLCPSAGEARTGAQAGSLRGSRAISHSGNGFFENFSTTLIRRSEPGIGEGARVRPREEVPPVAETAPRYGSKVRYSWGYLGAPTNRNKISSNAHLRAKRNST